MLGAHFSFSGLVWDTRPNVQVLTESIPLFFHPSDTYMQAKAARCFTAYRNALQSLNSWYDQLHAGTLGPSPNSPNFPDHDTFTSLDDETPTHMKFRIVGQFDHTKLLFKALGPNNERLCVKFTSKYSKVAHQFSHSLGFAPRLRGYEFLPGRWCLIVMDDVSDRYQECEDATMLSDADASLLFSRSPTFMREVLFTVISGIPTFSCKRR